MSEEWVDVPVGIDAQRWVTRPGCRMVLVIAHTVTSTQRLLDVVELLAGDLRIQVVFTRAPDVFAAGVDALLHDVGGVVIPWQQAVRTRFDLALAASTEGLAALHAPVVLLPHGAGFIKLAGHGSGDRDGAATRRVPFGLDASRLVHDGRVLVSTLVLSHTDQLDRLAETCPEALPAALVAGDPCVDKLLASLPRRDDYRAALGLKSGQKLVVVASTWTSRSLFGQRAEVVSRLLAELPRDEFRVAMLLHPNVWFGHGRWQVTAWSAGLVRGGLRLIPPELDWRAMLVAADWVIGDHGSTTAYAAVVGTPILLATFPSRDVDPDSAAAKLAHLAPWLRDDASATAQLRAAAGAFDPDRYRIIAEMISSQPRSFAINMRARMYRLLDIPEPAEPPRTEPARLPEPTGVSRSRSEVSR